MTKIKCPFCKRAKAWVFENKQTKESFVYCTACEIETADIYTSKDDALKAFAQGKAEK